MMFLFLVLVCLIGCGDEYERVGGCPLALRAFSYSGLALLKISLFDEPSSLHQYIFKPSTHCHQTNPKLNQQKTVR